MGVYQSEDEPQQFLVRNTWNTEEDLIAHRAWMSREMLPTSPRTTFNSPFSVVSVVSVFQL